MIGRPTALPLYLSTATLLRVSAEGASTAIVLAVQARTGHAATAGFLQTAMTLPYILSGPVIGHAMDRVTRPRPFAFALTVAYAIAMGLLLVIAGDSPLVFALMVAAVIGCTEPIVVALTSLLPRFVPTKRLTRAYGLEASSYNLAGIAGPGLAAGFAAWLGGGGAGIPIVACAFLGLLALPLLPFRAPAEGKRAVDPEPSAEDLELSAGGAELSTGGAGSGAGSARAAVDVVIGGLTVLADNRVLRALTVATTLAWLGFGGIAVTAVLLAERIGAEASAGGQMLAAMAVGSLIGSLACARWLSVRHAETVMLAGLFAFGTALGSLALAPSLPWAMLSFLLAGVSEGPVFAATLMLRQRESPPDRLGQVNTTGGSLKIAASAVGAALTGTFADRIGPVGLVLAIAGCQFAGLALGYVILRTQRTSGRVRP
ncbi:MFS transporter [Actinomadura rudentiformis]|uniref:MFS transporter n=1 Tax=Actinomadura rudentiformis TaxID=359158 RepID=UPI00178C5499|nr:MFS transporter [Actinomadura rudentiformis]